MSVTSISRRPSQAPERCSGLDFELVSSLTNASQDVKKEQAPSGQQGHGRQAAEDATHTTPTNAAENGSILAMFLIAEQGEAVLRWSVLESFDTSVSIVVDASTTFRAWSRPGSMERNNIESFRPIFKTPGQPKPRSCKSSVDPSLAAAISAVVRRMVHGGSLVVRVRFALAKMLIPSAFGATASREGHLYFNIGGVADCTVCLQGTRAVVT